MALTKITGVGAPAYESIQGGDSSTGGNLFQRILKEVADRGGVGGDGTSVMNDPSIKNIRGEARDMLLMQIQVSRAHLRVEMTAKVADSIQSTFKRLQQG